MKLNIFLGFILFIQGLAFLLKSSPEDLNKSSHMLSALIAPDLSLGESASGTELQKWLDKQGVKAEESATRYEVDTEQMNAALKAAKISSSLREKLELSASINAISALSIVEAKDEDKPNTDSEIKLKVEGDSWRVSSAYGYPADQIKVKNLLQKLLAIKLDTLVARRTENHIKLRVAKTQYDRVVNFETKTQKTIKFYIGNGKSGSVHLRLAGDDLVYRVKNLSIWQDLSTSTTRLIDTSYVALKEPKILEIKGPRERIIKMEHRNEQWFINNLALETIDQDRAKRFVNAAKELIITEVVGKEIKDSYGFEQGAVVTLKNGKNSLSYRLGEGGKELIFAKAKHKDFIVKVPSYKVKSLLSQTLDELLTEAARAAQQTSKASTPNIPTVNSDTPPNTMPIAPHVVPAPSPVRSPASAPSPTPAPAPSLAPASAPSPAPAPAPSPTSSSTH